MSARDQGELDARLDEAFRRFPDTDELHDLKDELRASLAARVAELEASGSGPTAAVTAAFDELGDLAQLVAEVTGEPVSAADPAAPTDASRKPTDAASRASDAFELLRRHKVRPRPLFVVRTVAHLWRQEAQTRNAQEIAKRGAELYDHLVGFVTELEKVGKNLAQASDAYHSAFNKLSRNRGNVIRRAEMLKDLGIQPSKALPAALAEAARDEDFEPKTPPALNPPAQAAPENGANEPGAAGGA